MSVVTGQNLGGGFATLYKQNNTNRQWKETNSVSKKRDNYTRFQRAFIPGESYLASCKVLWDTLSSAEQNAWRTAGDYTDLDGYNLFVQDQTYRLKNSIPGFATPSNFHQYKIGHIVLPVSNVNALFRQAGGYTPLTRLEMHTWFKSVLEADGAAPNTAILRFRYYYLSGGILTPKIEEISYPLSSDWDDLHHAVDVVANASGGYEFEFEFNHVKGDFYFDNTYAYDFGNINSRDRYCNRVDHFWRGLNLPAGVSINSEYPTD